MAGSYRKAAGEVWSYEPTPKGARFIFLPTAILGGLGSVGFGVRLQQSLVAEGELSLTAVAGLAFSLLMLMAGIGAIAYRTKVEVDRSQGVITSHRRALWIRRRSYEILEVADSGVGTSRLFQRFLLGLIAKNVVVATASTV